VYSLIRIRFKLLFLNEDYNYTVLGSNHLFICYVMEIDIIYMFFLYFYYILSIKELIIISDVRIQSYSTFIVKLNCKRDAQNEPKKNGP
jgi:hypothetical protein